MTTSTTPLPLPPLPPTPPPTPTTAALGNYLLKITLPSTSLPTITRILSVPAGINFHDLHLIIQTAFSWEHEHGYQFEVEPAQSTATSTATATRSTDPPPTTTTTETEACSTSTHLSTVLSAQTPIIHYIYDRTWTHRIHHLGRAVCATRTAVCVAGEGHACAEDCGGPQGWRELKRAFVRPWDETDQKAYRMRKWYRGECSNRDAEGLEGGGVYRWDCDGVNRELERVELGVIPGGVLDEDEEGEDGE